MNAAALISDSARMYWIMAALILIIPTAFNVHSSAITMQGCGDNNPLVMVENTNNYNVTCNNIGGTDLGVVWDRRQGSSAGECGPEPTSCKQVNIAIAVVSRPTYGTTTMTVKITTRQLFGNQVVTCTSRTSANPPVTQSQDSCTVDVVVPAVLSASRVEVVKTSPRWRVRANTTITNVFSSQGRYTCDWYNGPQSGSPVGSDSSPSLRPASSDTSDLSNRTGWCSTTWTMPLTTANYNYVVVASPGGTRQSAATLNITRPATPTLGSGCPRDYIPELSPVTCRCVTNNLGTPAGEIGWSGQPSSPVLTLANVTRTQHNNNYTCSLTWSDVTLRHTLNLKVAYGPDPGTTSITSADVTNGVFDTDGSRDLHVTCSTPSNAVNPAPSYSWDQPAGCTGQGQGQGQGSCSLRPQPPQNVTVTCRVTNQKNSGRFQTVNRIIVLNYPPTQPPGITGYTDGHVLYMNDSLSLTCDVSGGYPGVSQVTLKCDLHPQTVTPGQRGRLSIPSLLSRDHQTSCTCSATWKVTSLYTKSSSVSLTVHSPPSPPSIKQSSPAPLGFLEGDTPTLTCNSSEQGVPPAVYTWSGHRDTLDTVLPSPGNSRLQMAPLTRHDNHRVIVCDASNDFTQHRYNVTPSNYTVTVYYVSALALTSSADNKCSFRSDLDPGHESCVVGEGQAISVQCSGSSNPEVGSIRWTSPSGQHNDPSAKGQLVIPSADRQRHNTQFTCTATTRNSSPPDSRLPLSNTTSIRVYVTYPSSLITMTFNNATTNLTVKESDVTSVSMRCRADGRPTPRMQLFRKHDGAVLKSETGGVYTESDDDSVLHHVIREARCEDTGEYLCVSDNGLGQEERQALTLLVNCAPRRADPSPEQPPTVNYEGRPVQLSVNLVASPPPDTFTFVFHGAGNNLSQPVTTGTLHSRCWRSSPVYLVTCNVTVQGIAARDAGFYSAHFGNRAGNSSVAFQVQYFGKEEITDPDPPPIAAIAGGIAAVAAVCVVIAVAVVIVRRRQIDRTRSRSSLPTGPQNDKRYEDEEEPEMITNELYGTTPSPAGASAGFKTGTQQTSPYEDVSLPVVKPAVLPKPGANSGNVYAVVNKEKQHNGNPKGSSDVYAVVDKSKLTSINQGTFKDSPEQLTGKKTEKQTKQIKSKPNGKQGKKSDKGDKQPLKAFDDQAGAVYSNTSPLSMTPVPNQGTVYENYAFQEETEPNPDKVGNPLQEEALTVNPDGLVYTTIAFTDDQRKKAEGPPPERETTEYADINFAKSALK